MKSSKLMKSTIPVFTHLGLNSCMLIKHFMAARAILGAKFCLVGSPVWTLLLGSWLSVHWHIHRQGGAIWLPARLPLSCRKRAKPDCPYYIHPFRVLFPSVWEGVGLRIYLKLPAWQQKKQNIIAILIYLWYSRYCFQENLYRSGFSIRLKFLSDLLIYVIGFQKLFK